MCTSQTFARVKLELSDAIGTCPRNHGIAEMSSRVSLKALYPLKHANVAQRLP